MKFDLKRGSVSIEPAPLAVDEKAFSPDLSQSYLRRLFKHMRAAHNTVYQENPVLAENRRRRV